MNDNRKRMLGIVELYILKNNHSDASTTIPFPPPTAYKKMKITISKMTLDY